MSAVHAGPSREVAPGVHWLGGCFEIAPDGRPVHYHVSAYLLVGSERTLMFDTGDPAHWDAVARQLDALLGGRPLDYVVPSHPELPHAGNLPALVARYPGVEIHGDVRDYHLYYPEVADRLVPRPIGARLDLGAGREVEILPALIQDLPNSVWAHDPVARMLFVADGFCFLHDRPGLPAAADDDPPHLPGECRLMSGELAHGPTVEQAAHGTGRALYWTRFVDVTPTFREVDRLLRRCPTELIGPCHGAVVSDVRRMLPISVAAHERVFEG